MTFASPQWLWALLAVPVLLLVEWWATRRDLERTARLVARPLWDRVLTRPRPCWRWVRLTLLALGALGVALALARPQWGVVREKIEREGVDVVLVLDTSGSMAVEDVAPNRFFLARNALLSLLAKLEGDRFALVAFEGEAYPLVPLTLDADAIGLFLETLEPGIVPAPGSSLGQGLAKGLDLFVDRERQNKVMVLVSDGEDLEGEVEGAVTRAREAGVVVHAVGVGTEKGEPVPDLDPEGRRTGFKKDDSGNTVVSRLHAETLEAIAKGTGGKLFRLTTADSSLAELAAALEGMEQRTLAREYAYRKKERFQVPLGVALVAFALAALLPLPLPLKRRPRAAGPAAQAGAVLSLLLWPARARADSSVADEVLLRPRRLTAEGKAAWSAGSHPQALEAFQKAAATRPEDPAAKFNLADGLYKNGKFQEAEEIYRALAGDVRSPLAAASRYNLGNTLYQKQDWPGAVKAYREALRLAPEDGEAKRNLELALRQLQKQQQEQQKQDQDKNKDQQDKKQQSQDQKDEQKKQSPSQQPSPPPRSEEQKEQERFQKETGMSRERAMQLLQALQQNEKDEQKKLLAASPAPKRQGKDW